MEVNTFKGWDEFHLSLIYFIELDMGKFSLSLTKHHAMNTCGGVEG